jgi:beta-lactamase class A
MRRLAIAALLLFLLLIPIQIALAESFAQGAIAPFQQLSGQVSILVEKDNVPIVALNADESLASASTFKLQVLATLYEEILSGSRQWEDVIKVRSQDRSLPSGILQSWPNNSPLTLQTLATLMISMSDNTATDALIHLLGRETIEATTDKNRPFLTTREAFILKNPDNKAILQQYREADEKTRRQLLKDLKQAPLPDVDLFKFNIPLATEIEWFFSTRELCHLIQQVANLPLMQINPGIANADKWQNVAFKGGSEPGVLNLTNWLTTSEATHYCVSATWNGSGSLDENRFYALYNSLIESLN